MDKHFSFSSLSFSFRSSLSERQSDRVLFFLRGLPCGVRDLQTDFFVCGNLSRALQLVVFPVSAVQSPDVSVPDFSVFEKQDTQDINCNLYAGFQPARRDCGARRPGWISRNSLDTDSARVRLAHPADPDRDLDLFKWKIRSLPARFSAHPSTLCAQLSDCDSDQHLCARTRGGRYVLHLPLLSDDSDCVPRSRSEIWHRACKSALSSDDLHRKWSDSLSILLALCALFCHTPANQQIADHMSAECNDPGYRIRVDKASSSVRCPGKDRVDPDHTEQARARQRDKHRNDGANRFRGVLRPSYP